jgi:transketolase
MGIILLAKEHNEDEKAMRDVYCETLMDIAKTNPNLIVMDADLMAAVGVSPFAKAYPERTINCGIQEANMIGVAAGLSALGKIPFAHTFATFATRRACDQVFLSGAYAGLNVKIIGSDPGVTASLNGGTHMPFEDIGIMRTIPTMTIIEPTDAVMLENLVRQAADQYGMFYIRLSRKKMVKIFEKGSVFTVGKGIILKEGRDVTIMAAGICVADSLKAADMLEKEGISCRVVNLFTIKPIDAELIVKCANETGAIVTAENHNTMNGLGSAVAEVLVENTPVPMERIGVNDEFGEVGTVDYLKERFSMTPNDIAAKARKAFSRKKGRK